MFKSLEKEMKRYGIVGVLLIVGILFMIAFIIGWGIPSSTATVRAVENENTFMTPIATGDWWTAITSVYTNVLGAGVFFGIMILLPCGMLWIKLRNAWPPTMLLIIGSSIFGVLLDSIVFRFLMILFIGFGIAIVLYKTFSKSGA